LSQVSSLSVVSSYKEQSSSSELIVIPTGEHIFSQLGSYFLTDYCPSNRVRLLPQRYKLDSFLRNNYHSSACRNYNELPAQGL